MLRHRVLVLPFAGPAGRVPGKSPGGIGENQAGDAGAGGANAQHQGNTAAASVLGKRVGACWLSQLFPTQESSEGLKSAILSKFTLLRKALEDCQWQTVARIEQEQAAALGRVGEDWSLLKDHLDVLGQHRERAQSLLACPDHRTFLQVPSQCLVPPCARLLLAPRHFGEGRDVVNPFPRGEASSARLRDGMGLQGRAAFGGITEKLKGRCWIRVDGDAHGATGSISHPQTAQQGSSTASKTQSPVPQPLCSSQPLAPPATVP